MGKRPRLRPEPNQTDEIIELSGWIFVVILWGLSLYSYSTLPDRIPTHFDVVGMPDKWGSRNAFFVLPVVGTVVFIGLTILNRYPYLFNYPVTITNENALAQYTNATKMMRWLKLSLGLLWCLINRFTYSISEGKANRFNYWLLSIPVLMILIPTIYFTTKSIKMDKKTEL
ncbi:MAG TPA: DUF1648 domain-containing protein [Puia sp.]|nr:DUF1648 domain-containing protein [Puia sp.]